MLVKLLFEAIISRILSLKIILRQDHLKQIWLKYVQILFLERRQRYIKLKKDLKAPAIAYIVRFYDELYQPNAIDKDGIPQQKCDESWSMDNLRVRAVKYQ